MQNKLNQIIKHLKKTEKHLKIIKKYVKLYNIKNREEINMIQNIKNNKEKVNVFDVANYIIKQKKELNHLRLQKIIYYSHIQSLIANKKPLFDEPIEAWLYGPVVPILYDYIKENNGGFIISNSYNKGNFQKLTLEEKAIIDNVFNKIQKFETFEISEITHNQKPWKDKFFNDDSDSDKTITNVALIEYFSNKQDFFESDKK